MKHIHLRKDKNCLNCGTFVEERYCTHCGQENTEPKESFGHLISHFFADVTHYDSQVLTTIKDLVFKPGFLTKEYQKGKRVSYLNPIRMYIFISAVFFLITFSGNEQPEQNSSQVAGKTVSLYRQHIADSLRSNIKTGHLTSKDSADNSIYKAIALKLDTPVVKKDMGESLNANINNGGVVTFEVHQDKFKNVGEYEADQRKLPASQRDGRISSYFSKKIIMLTSKTGQNGTAVIAHNLKHDIPKIMFLLLPLFAFFVGISYNRKKYYYSQHLIFSLHFHSFLFIALMLDGLVSLVLPMDKVWFYESLTILLVIYIYLVAALRNVYEQAIWLSAIKGLAISALYIIVFIVIWLFVLLGLFVFG